MDQKKLKILNKSSFVRFLDSISKISDSVILSVCCDKQQITSIVTSADKTIAAWCEASNIDTDFTGNLNVPDVKKFLRAIDNINTTEIAFIVNSNNIEYRDKAFKFKYHMYEDGFLTKPAINIDKVLSFEQNVQFELKKETVQSLIRGSTFATDTNKLYLYTSNNRLRGELTDRSKHNTDIYELDLGLVDFDLSPIPLNLDNIKQLSLLTDCIRFGINTKFGVSIVDIEDSDIKFKYILTSLTQ